ncbi:hypothetical protein [Aeromonas dhakensis]|uniref:hypothetical protein n=1 Tax=Aeromonas dhakensis TaxID=196024 RepID=UPI00111B21FE|nr:hypothetical protein [Aeromonas dhakensis]TNI47138.1 hypothetical protein CF130_05035 [Aeromonas dhakensis]
MSDHLTRKIDLYRLQDSQDMAVCSLNTLALLLRADAPQLKHIPSFNAEEFAYGISGLLTLLAKDLHTNAIDISELHDQLRHEGVRQ